MCLCVLAFDIWVTTVQTRPLSHANKFTSLAFLTRVHTLNHTVSVRKSPDEMQWCVDPLTWQCGWEFVMAPKRKVVRGWENVQNELLSAFHCKHLPWRFICFLHHLMCVEHKNTLTINLNYCCCHMHKVCAKISQWVYKKLYVFVCFCVTLLKFLSCFCVFQLCKNVCFFPQWWLQTVNTNHFFLSLSS